MEYDVVIGLEIHVELQTFSKMFCGCTTAFGLKPNTSCCPICLGLPGTLPVFNRRAIELAVTAALALNSEIQRESRFDRKNYFYPDLPKAYQISQYDHPLAKGGYLDLDYEGTKRRINLERIHLEEEAGKLLHAGDSIMESSYSFVDYNRAGIPLLEIVTAPELHSGKEARLFLENLRTLLLYCGASDCKMEEGSLRCDANISLRPAGYEMLGTKAEVKNMNSFRSVEMALNYEAKRQESILVGGGQISQETCHWDEENKVTYPLRSKEGSSDYRYFPEPDLLPLILDSSFIEAIKAGLPELPAQRHSRMMQEYGLEKDEADLFITNSLLGNFFEAAAADYKNYNQLSRWVQGDFLYQLRESGRKPDEVNANLLVELLTLLDEEIINRPTAKELLVELIKNGSSPREAVENRSLGRISGEEKLLPLVEQVIADNPEAVKNYRLGKEKALAYLVGQVMARTRGRADPIEVTSLLKKKI